MIFKQKINYLLVAICLSCNNDHLLIKQESEVIKDILLQIVSDSNFYPLTPPPPPQKLISFNNSKIDSMNESYANEYKKFAEKLDVNRHVISFEDSTDLITDKSIIVESLKEKNYNGLIFKTLFQENEKRLPIEIPQIKKFDKFELINRRVLFPKGFNFKKYKGFDLPFYFYGIVSFSKSYLNDSGDYGFIVYKRECGFECDQKYILIIKKQNNKWILVEKIYAR
jgi:hypothetical protein